MENDSSCEYLENEINRGIVLNFFSLTRGVLFISGSTVLS